MDSTFFVTIYHKLLLLSTLGEDFQDFPCFEDLEEAYKIVFEASIFEIGDTPDEFLRVEDKEICFITSEEGKVDRCDSFDSFCTGVSEVLNDDELEEYEFEITELEIKKLECLLQGNDKSLRADEVSVNNKWSMLEQDNLCSKRETNNDPEMSHRLRASVRSTDSSEMDYADFYNSVDSSPNGTNFANSGSMRKEKEWRKTLACKIFEERHNQNHNVNGSEAMDSLWETYELQPDNNNNNNNTLQQSKSKSKSKSKSATPKRKSNNSSKWGKDLYDHERVGDEDEDDEIYDGGQVCCLQALKFSAGKMNLGMKKPNLVKISKALKGFGWLHHVSSRHGKKVHP
ncbi:hypothetical protein ACFE04_001253 [Oxalis oulophora]